ncbi:uncharacterized protein BT62DRAFT_932961 [Guyanagaster necrorhizus]|uniref:Uncharacterized protein n=1 Tax=Guyanagaster necrorhizus TaxID=856835 RepID=A0A9P7VSJ3_9AGAR|nr:uncharacterized protein BT62DRAFT_932961 [Guyanagaster necrorhizus MCA 3950]KAG7445797.1 hypothetical protein BT62DRAFT_932961 [Guyanagaster necrorhizus MCA 3950]
MGCRRRLCLSTDLRLRLIHERHRRWCLSLIVTFIPLTVIQYLTTNPRHRGSTSSLCCQ